MPFSASTFFFLGFSMTIAFVAHLSSTFIIPNARFLKSSIPSSALLFAPTIAQHYTTTTTTLNTENTSTSSLKMSKTWFEQVFGFKEDRNYDKVRSSFRLEDNDTVLVTIPPPGGGAERRFYIGPFETPSVKQLRHQLEKLDNTAQCAATTSTEIDFAKPIAKRAKSNEDLSTLQFSHIIGSADELHLDPDNANAVFQAASQFNCLEMVNPKIKPTNGITRYENDGTQGPACAMACPAATIYRNYLVHGGKGQKEKQIDTLEDVGNLVKNVEILENGEKRFHYWKMQNGYALPARKYAMAKLRQEFEDGNISAQVLMEHVRVGVHEDTEIFDPSSTTKPTHRVAQVYCSAVPVGYDYFTPRHDWEPFAKLVLDASYDATLATAAILARKRQTRIKVYLTKVGGGVFMNSSEWIIDAMKKALDRYREYPLDVYLVHFGRLESDYEFGLGEIK